jgi:hypothetical protein
MVSSRKTISNESDRYIMELGQARELFRTWDTTKQRVLTNVRMEWLERIYGKGSVDRIRGYMDKLRTGELE